MSAEHAFQLLNVLVLPWWAVWLAAPRSRWAVRLAAHGGVFVALGAVYAVLLGMALASGGDAGLGFDGLRAALARPLGFLAGWAHYLAFDLFVGAWILREAARLGVEPRPYLLVTLMAGPLGLMAFLVRRTLLLRSAGQLGRTDLV